MGKIKLALVGCGGISGAHIKGYKRLHDAGCREFEVVACCDPNEAAAQTRAAEIAQFQGSAPKVFSDLRKLADARCADAADVCVPHCFHHSTAIPLLEAGLHVLLEKPVGITIKASKKIIAAAAKHGRTLATAENVRRELPARAATWALKDAQLIGELVMADVQVVNNGPLNLDDPKFRWRAVKLLTGGGMIMDSGAHFTDMMLHTFGDVDEVSCVMRTLDTREVSDLPRLGRAKVDVEDYWHAVLRFKSGMVLHWTFSNCLQPMQERAGIYYGRKGTAKDAGFPFHAFQGGCGLTCLDKNTLSPEQVQVKYLLSLSEEKKKLLFPYGVTEGFAVEVWDFVNAIATGRAPEMDGLAGLRAKTLSECCYESATLGRPVKFAEVLEGAVNAYQKPIDEFWEI